MKRPLIAIVILLLPCLQCAPIPFLPSEPMAVNKQSGNDVKSAIPGLASLGYGDVHKTISRYTPDGSPHDYYRNTVYNPDDRPNLGYMDRETSAGRSVGSKNLFNLPGIGRFEYGEEREQGSGILDFSKSMFPFLQLPPLKEERVVHEQPLFSLDEVKKENYGRLMESSTLSPRSFSPFGPSLFDQDLLPQDARAPAPFQGIPSIVDENAPVPDENQAPPTPFGAPKSPFDAPGAPASFPISTDADQKKSDNPFEDIAVREIMKRVMAARRAPLPTTTDPKEKELRRKEIRRQADVLKAQMGAPASELGISKKEIYALCARFAPIADQQCNKQPIAPEFVDKCRGYLYDCQEFHQQSRPLGAIANAFKSGVGMTLGSWGVNGIPYYPINEEGGIGGGSHGKVDFGSYGGGYSYNSGQRDFFSQTGEVGGNWYEGTYGSKTGWSVPVAQALGVEGGGGTQISVPLKEGEFGKPIEASSGYHVGPYFGAAEKIGVDWMEGGVSMNRGVAVPIAGVSVNTGVGLGFPGVGALMRQWSFADPTSFLARGVTTSNGAMSESTIYG